MKPFDLFTTALEGLNLIEASAGTGKTYNITGLYVRLVLEQARCVDGILVVTYTNAATAELRERIRGRLVAVREAIEAGASDDPFCREIIERLPDPDQASRRLKAAILDFDRAAIYTIHGFCQRVLADNAFESGMPFETELVPEQGELLQEIADDFWRLRVQNVPAGLADYLLDQKVSPEQLLTAVRNGLGKPYLEVRGREFPGNLEALEADFRSAFQQAREKWREEGAEIKALLRADKALNGNKYRKNSLENWFLQLESYLEERPGQWFDRFEKFTSDELARSVKKGHSPPTHPFFDSCRRLREVRELRQSAFEQALVALKQELLAHCNRELAQRQAKEQVQSYDDLLLNLYRALQGKRGKTLASTIRRQYGAALIDEFQDTDPIQYEIFGSIYHNSGLPVFLVGDPKQAIYSFRGADIFAYLEAREDAGAFHTLDVNWRSDPLLVDAVNALFDQPHDSFFYDRIPFHRSRPANKEPEPFLTNDEEGAPFRFWFLEGSELSADEAREAATDATANEIARLLNLGIQGGDMAVLVRDHRQGALIRDRLRQHRINSVQRTREDVFRSAEAEELERLLLAVAEPGRHSRIMAALATSTLGLDANRIAFLRQDETALERHLEAFRDYHYLWRERGFIRMFRHLLTSSGAMPRLLAPVGGERRLTNLLHLGELLHRQESIAQPGMEGLINWLAQRRRALYSEDTEAELRLESDETLVQIVTIHKSKGLQYKVVFCPFLWEGRLSSRAKRKGYSFHDPEKGFKPVLELGSERMEADRGRAVQEELAENLRLLYVALTRARHRCYLAWGNIRPSAAHSALAWLLHPPPDPMAVDAVVHLAASFKALADASVRGRLDTLAASAPEAISVEPLPVGREETPSGREKSGTPLAAARRFTRRLECSQRVTSFTALTANQSSGELPDYDAGDGEEGKPRAEGPSAGIHAFPRGARAGRCLHAIFERLDFTRGTPDIVEPVVREALILHGFDEEWKGVIADMVKRVLATPLDEKRHCALRSVTPDRRVVEMEFYYPLAPIQVEEVRRLLLEHGFAPEGSPLRPAVERLVFDRVQGFMKGYIDLVFEVDGRYYLTDYKSNWLGNDTAAYERDRLREVIAGEAYFLQYLLYTIALHRYLEQRLPDYEYDRCFGGVYYLFLRGMRPEKGAESGVYFHRPSKDLIEALDGYFR